MSTSSKICKDGASKSSNDVCEVNDMLQNISTVDNKDDSNISVCANFGKGEEEIGKLKHCTACKLVKYCSRECQIAHRSQHKKECKKRAAELHDEELFKKPPNPHGDCPICFLRLPYIGTGSRYQSCCGKVICSGCFDAPVYDDQGNVVDKRKCAFCRVPTPDTEDEAVKRLNKRSAADDAEAIHITGYYYRDGRNEFPQDIDKAFEHWRRAGELGYSKAYNSIGCAYHFGEGVEVDMKKAIHYYELGAMGGDETARYNLGIMEKNIGNMDRALKHWMIAAGSGSAESMKMIKQMHSNRLASKDDYTKTLQSYQALGEIKSVQRDKAAAADDDYRYY